MEFDWTGVLLSLVKLLAHQLWQHFVYSEVSQKRVIILQELPLVLELFEVALEFVEADNFGDARDV